MKEETRREVFARSGYICEICGKPVSQYGTPQIAHRIHKGVQAENYVMAFVWNNYQKDRSRKWSAEILNSPENLRAVCSLKCNDKCNIFFNDVERDELLNYIVKKVLTKESMIDISIVPEKQGELL